MYYRVLYRKPDVTEIALMAPQELARQIGSLPSTVWAVGGGGNILMYEYCRGLANLKFPVCLLGGTAGIVKSQRAPGEEEFVRK